MKMALIFMREHIEYVVQNPSLLWIIPKRFWEEFSLYARYIFAKYTRTFKNGKLIQQLTSMRKDMNDALPEFKPALVWQDLYNQFERVLYVENIKNFKTQRYNLHFSTYAPTNPRFYTRFLWVYWQLLQKTDSLKLLNTLEEPQLGNPAVYQINASRMSYDLLQSVDEFYSIYPHIRKQRTRLLITELGAGYGRLGYVFLKALPNTTYVIVDQPGSLIISQYYLSHLFPKNKVLTYEASKQIRNFTRTNLSKYNLVFMAPWQLPAIADKSIDVFINIYSFQEMTLMHIRNYFNVIDKKVRGLFYSKQQYEAENLKDRVEVTLADYPVKKGWTKLFEKQSTISQDIFEALYKI